jgi:hypothetical protein
MPSATSVVEAKSGSVVGKMLDGWVDLDNPDEDWDVYYWYTMYMGMWFM